MMLSASQGTSWPDAIVAVAAIFAFCAVIGFLLR